MPVDKRILGFGNRWYPLAVRTAHSATLPSGAEIRLIRAPLFIATKLEAFLDRGKGDFLMSHDLGDALAVIDGREALLAEFEAVDAQVAGFVGDVVASLLATQKFASYLPGHLPGDAATQARLPELEAKLARIAELAKR